MDYLLQRLCVTAFRIFPRGADSHLGPPASLHQLCLPPWLTAHVRTLAPLLLKSNPTVAAGRPTSNNSKIKWLAATDTHTINYPSLPF